MKRLSKDEARRPAANLAKLRDLLRLITIRVYGEATGGAARLTTNFETAPTLLQRMSPFI
jgi:hypothetical protein